MPEKSQPPSLWSRDEFEPLRSLHREIDRVFDSFGSALPWMKDETGAGRFSLPVDLSETDTELEVTTELPGVGEEDIDVSVADNVLTIKGEKKAEKEIEEENYHMVERSYGAFQRSVTLPCEVKADKVKAKFENGVLTVTLPKSPDAAPKIHKIKVKSA